MKKGAVVWLIVALVLVVAGGALFALGFSGLSMNSETDIKVGLNNHYIEREETVRESFTGVTVDTQDCDVTIVPVPETQTPRVVIRELEKTPHDIRVENGVLKIKMQDKRGWLDFINVSFENMSITLYLPQKQYDSVNIVTATGSIDMGENFAVKEAKLTSDTGSIACNSMDTALLEAASDTGKVWVHGCAAEKLRLSTDTGDVEVFGIARCDTLTAKSDTGKVTLKDVACKTLTAETATGDVELRQVLAETELQVSSATGCVYLDECDSALTTIETETGDVDGHFLTPKVFETQTVTGDVEAGSVSGGDLCRVRTTTGDINLQIAD